MTPLHSPAPSHSHLDDALNGLLIAVASLLLLVAHAYLAVPAQGEAPAATAHVTVPRG